MTDFRIVNEELCRKKSLVPVASPSDCVALTGSIQIEFKGYSFDTIIDSPMFPKGCFVLLINGTQSLLDNPKGYFNSHESGSKLNFSSSICKNPKGV